MAANGTCRVPMSQRRGGRENVPPRPRRAAVAGRRSAAGARHQRWRPWRPRCRRQRTAARRPRSRPGVAARRDSSPAATWASTATPPRMIATAIHGGPANSRDRQADGPNTPAAPSATARPPPAGQADGSVSHGVGDRIGDVVIDGRAVRRVDAGQEQRCAVDDALVEQGAGARDRLPGRGSQDPSAVRDRLLAQRPRRQFQHGLQGLGDGRTVGQHQVDPRGQGPHTDPDHLADRPERCLAGHRAGAGAPAVRRSTDGVAGAIADPADGVEPARRSRRRRRMPGRPAWSAPTAGRTRMAGTGWVHQQRSARLDLMGASDRTRRLRTGRAGRPAAGHGLDGFHHHSSSPDEHQHRTSRHRSVWRRNRRRPHGSR